MSHVRCLLLRSTFAATAPRSAVAELGVVRRLRTSPVKALLFLLFGLLFPVVGRGGDPKPTTKTVLPSDITGTWRYPLMFKSGHALLSLRDDGTYELRIESKPLGVITKQGKWTLDKADLTLTPFWTVSPIDPNKIEQRDSMSWFVTDVSPTAKALYGGDCVDPDYWRIIPRTK